MKRMKWMLALLLVLALLQTLSAAAATQNDSDNPLIDQEAMAILMKMADFLAHAKSFSVSIETGYEVLQESGQMIEFGAVRKMIIERPDHARVDILHRDGTKAEFIYNGKQIYVFNARDNVFGTVEKPGTIDQAMSYFTEDLAMRLPLSELCSTNLPDLLRQHVRVLHYVDTALIDGATCDHLAARTDTVDFQVWIEQGEKPLPQRTIITYKNAAGEPQFWAQFNDWDLSPKVSKSTFAIKPPEGAEQISFAALMQIKSEAGEKKGD
jgi:hypothetical protein